tara:strand:- start:1902 stop:3530 length:1629 start_codon:yes stop_codon:yes gene_type:complete
MRFTLLLSLFSCTLFAQQDSITYKYWLQFSDKDDSGYFIDTPEDFLSKRAIERRENQDIAIKKSDLPVNENYIDSIKEIGFKILGISRWLNGVIVSSNDSNLYKNINCEFIDSIFYFGSWSSSIESSKINLKFENDFTVSDYGNTYNQIKMLSLDFLHSKGFTGDGIIIAVLDAGFNKTDKLTVFENLFNEERILGTFDFVHRDNDVYSEHSHGTMVLSTIAGEDIGNFIGSSPNASFWLFRTEDVASENVIEEYYWLLAAEYADSAGVDIINSSLGYTTFDNPNQSHTYKDMDGKTTVVSIAANMASRKGMIVVNSAGNSGNSNWHYIGAPADADSILSVGAIDENMNYAFFSSYGPTVDGRVKPNIVAQGKNTIVVNTDNVLLHANGTSFSSPLIAGAAANLWQAHPDRTNIEIIDAIILSSHLNTNPNDSFGYGIPNFALSDLILKDPIDKFTSEVFTISPNPINSMSHLYIYSADNEMLKIEIYNTNGKRIKNYSIPIIPRSNNRINIAFLKNISYGSYFMKVIIGQQEFVQKFMIIE